MFFCLFVKARIYRIEILRVHAVLRDANGVGKSLIMNDFALAEVFDGIADVGVIHKAENVVVGHASLLLCYYHVFATKLSLAKVRKILIFQGFRHF